ncbi:hypothetical protein Poli38472_000749 [Pythium oligandrum]|uniref:Uncharacterized protein n=1 Tax=Pythium oligandrum TaxID=41045 RepID=A0A8K1FIE8_PYTOL|nr:hypothetical protein Poli38472_000749 [Pythium oligandrum]|eukprot:TMW60707.1 hypothetical protein Poli38472_000749 [Pythium oligandrum]
MDLDLVGDSGSEADEYGELDGMTLAKTMFTPDTQEFARENEEKPTTEARENAQQSQLVLETLPLEASRVDPENDAELIVEDGANPNTPGGVDEESEDEMEEAAPQGPRFKIGDIVHVAARTWPGINKLGGAGKIATILEEVDESGEPTFLYNVKYMLGGFEKRIEEEFIEDLVSTLEQGARPHKGRVFYHEEFAHEPNKKKRTANMDNEPKTTGQADTSVTVQKPKLVKTPTPRREHGPLGEDPLTNEEDDPAIEIPSSDDSDFVVGDESDAESSRVTQKLDDYSFIMASTPQDSVVREKESRDRVPRASAEKMKKRKRRRRSDESGKAEKTQSQKRSRRIVVSDSESGGDASRLERQQSKKRRYVGGYVHGTEDPEGRFIQPEGDLAGLPEDILRELNIKLGKSKGELRNQLNTVADRLLENLRVFELKKKEALISLNRVLSLNDDEAHQVNRTLVELGDFVRRQLIRSGEDVINEIIKLLEKKGGSLPERIDLQFEHWKQQISDHDIWVKKSLRSLESVFAHRGMSTTFSRELLDNQLAGQDDYEDANASHEEDLAPQDVSKSDSDDFIEVWPQNIPRKPEPRRRRTQDAEERRYRGVQSRKRSLPTKTQSTLDDYEFHDYERIPSAGLQPTSRMSNFRLTRERPQTLSKDPKWDWARKMKHSNQQTYSTAHRVAQVFRGVKAGRTATTKDTSGSVQIARLKLRDKRYRNPSFPSQPRLHNNGVYIMEQEIMRQDAGPRGMNNWKRGERSMVQDLSLSTHAQMNDMEPSSDDNAGWERIFKLLTEDMSLPLKVEVDVSNEIGPVFYNDTIIFDEWCDEHDFKRIVDSAAIVRQGLTTLRLKEFSVMAALNSTKYGQKGEKLEDSLDWKLLNTEAEEYHSMLRSFSANTTLVFQDLEGAEHESIMKDLFVEIARSLKQLPDCNTVFGSLPAYPYFFNVASPEATTTPLLTAINRSYWYYIQILVVIKDRYATLSRGGSMSSLAVLDILPPNRVALASCLFLVDLNIYLPVSHRRNRPLPEASNSNVALSAPSTPALSLWLLLQRLLSDGALQVGTNSIGSTNLWTFLQTTYQQRFVEELVIGYLDHKSNGGYVRERAPVGLDKGRNKCAVLQSQLFAADQMWDICVAIGSVHQTSSQEGHDSQWGMVKELMHPTNPDLLPFADNVSSSLSHDKVDLGKSVFKLRVLRRLLYLSAILPPSSDIAELALRQLWDSGASQTSLSEIIAFLEKLREVDSTSDDKILLSLFSEEAEDLDATGLLARIILIQVSKLDKAIYRNRFRQPVLREISARFEIHKLQNAQSANTSSTKPAVKDPVRAKTTWQWGNQAATAVQNVEVPVEKACQSTVPLIKNRIAEAGMMVSILVALAASSLCLEQDAASVSSRRRTLKREVEFYCKELWNIGSDVIEIGSYLGDALCFIGASAIDANVGYSTVFQQLNNLLKRSSDKYGSADKVEGDEIISPEKKAVCQDALATMLSSLKALRDLSLRLIDRIQQQKGGPMEAEDVRTSITMIINSGLSSCLESAADNLVPVSVLDVALELLMMWIPQQRYEPNQCLAFRKPTAASSGEFDEFGEFDDDVWATVDLDNISNQAPTAKLFGTEVVPFAREVALQQLRISLQRLVINFPTKRDRSYQEMFAIDLLGYMISTCSFQFSWSTVSLSSLRTRTLAPRLFAAILKYNPEKQWFSTCYLSEQNADQDLTAMWLMSTLDLKALSPLKATYQLGGTSSICTSRYSTYWSVMTDALMASLLKDDQVVRYKMDAGLHRLLWQTASQCTFPDHIRANSDPDNARVLYDMHIGVFRSFCASTRLIWEELNVDPVSNRLGMNRFRLKMMDSQRGIFAALPEAYEINLRSVCSQLDGGKVNWYRLSAEFLDVFAPLQSARTLHDLEDDSTHGLDKSRVDPAIQPLVTLFRFMYDCVDSFLFHSSAMAIGQQNIFFSVMKLMFRQAYCAEFPLAEKRLARQPTMNDTGAQNDWLQLNQQLMLKTIQDKSISSVLSTVSPACRGFIESVRLFFAFQKYPSLMNWFAQTLETYQTVKAGWFGSPLRILLYNVLDPHGPLGVHSYYPMEADSSSTQFDPSRIRREAFYLACGLFPCRCTASYEHTRSSHLQHNGGMNLKILRCFILQSFLTQLMESSIAHDEDVQETLIPVMQFMKAVLHHCNINDSANMRDNSESGFVASVEILPCFVHVAEQVILMMRNNDSLSSSISCVIFIEFVRITEELVRVNVVRPDDLVGKMLHIALRCAGCMYASLCKYSTAQLEPLFAEDVAIPFLDELAALKKRVMEIERVKAERIIPSSPTKNAEDYGVSPLRTRLDLLSAIRRLVKHCHQVLPPQDSQLSTLLHTREPAQQVEASMS